MPPVALFACSVADLESAPDGAIIRDSTGANPDIVKAGGLWGGLTGEQVRSAHPGRYLYLA